MATPRQANPDRTHECPRPGCRTRIDAVQLACRPDWDALPKRIRSRIWHAFRTPGKPDLVPALEEAVDVWAATNDKTEVMTP